MERASQPAVGLGATAAYGAGDVLKMGIGGGASKAAQTLSDYYIKRAEQYHPVIPIGAGNEVTVVFQDGFQLKTVEEMALERTQSRAEEDNPESPVPVPPSAESHLNGFNTDQMLKQLGNLNPQQFMSGSQEGQRWQIICRPVRRAMPPGMLSPGSARTVLVSEVHRHSATGHNGPDGSVCFMEGQHHAGEITG